MTTFLMLHTEAPTREAISRAKPPGRMVFATNWITDEDRAVYDECVEIPEPWDVPETLDALAKIPADRVICQAEWGICLGALFCERKGLPGPGARAAYLTANKYLCRETLRAAGVPQPEYRLVSSAAEIRRAGLGWPIVLKAVSSTLGRLVRKVERDEDLDAAVAAMFRALPDAPDVRRCAALAKAAGFDMGCDPLKQFLAESYAPGPPKETDGMIVGSEAHVFGVTEQVVSPPPHFYIEGYLFPAPDADGLAEISRRALAALGLRDTGFSIEFRGDRLIEVNGRFGEDTGFPELFAAGLGEAPILTHLRGAAPAPARGGHAIAYRNHYAAGLVLRVGEAPGVTAIVAPGDEIGTPGLPGYYPHVAWALATHRTSCHEAYVAARRRVDRLEVEIAPVPSGH